MVSKVPSVVRVYISFCLGKKANWSSGLGRLSSSPYLNLALTQHWAKLLKHFCWDLGACQFQIRTPSLGNKILSGDLTLHAWGSNINYSTEQSFNRPAFSSQTSQAHKWERAVSVHPDLANLSLWLSLGLSQPWLFAPFHSTGPVRLPKNWVRLICFLSP